MSSPRHYRAVKAARQRHYGEHDPRTVEAAHDLAAVVLEDHIREVVDRAPGLRPGDADRLAALLRGTS
jgi:hypothetical protein